MARKSRKGTPVTDAPITTKKPDFHAAVYARLSSEDREALSLDNQILMVKNYIAGTPGLSLSGVFSDNGMTGTNFNRPGFENLMDEVRRGAINCIVVKDLSRFGRDYMEAGNFLEVIFPRLNVRFISIGDAYDSFDPRCKGEGMSVAIKNMVNAFYAKDISVKIRTAYEVKRRNGEFVGKCPPFGYIKAPDNKNRLVVDAEAAGIVREIYAMKLDGTSVHQITRQLTARGVPNPAHYRYIKGIQKEERYRQPQSWDITVVKDILENIVYLGHLPLGKTKIVNGKQRAVPKKDWVIAKNAHDPVITQADFDAVAAQLAAVRERHDSLERHQREELPEYILEGLIFCSDCGRAYRRMPNTMRDKVTYRLTYVCVYCNKRSPKYTYRHFRQDELYNALYTILRQQIDVCAGLRGRMDAVRTSPAARKLQSEREKKIAHIQKELDRFPVKKQRLYDDYCDGALTKDDFRFLQDRQSDEKAALSAELSALLAESEKLDAGYIDGNPCMSVVDRFIGQKELSREMLLAMVQRIEVDGDRTIHVQFRFRDEYERLEAFVVQAQKALSNLLNIPINNIYTNILEMPHWGARGIYETAQDF